MRKTIRKHIALLAVLLPAMHLAYSQIPQDLVLSTYSNQTVIEATRSVTLKPGFYIPAPAAGVTRTIRIVGEPLSLQPDAGQNYILHTSYLSAAGGTMAADRMQDVQYFDGLGRPLQSLQGKASPGYRDIISQQTYDAFGREDRSYLPYSAVAGNNGKYRSAAITEQATFYNSGAANGVVTIPKPTSGTTVTPSFSRPAYEASPLNRMLEQGFPGAAWQPTTDGYTGGGHSVRTVYTTNNATVITDVANTRLAKLYKAGFDASGRPTLILSGNYAANELYVTITKDEDHNPAATGFAARVHTTEEYTDKQGRVVLKRTFNGTNEILSTYYVYDDFGNLTFVLTPGVNADSARPTEAELKAFCYMYQYDGRNRMKRRHLPGQRAWESFNYNMMDQLIIHETSKDSTETYNGYAGRFHHFYKYDGQGRVITTGIERGRTGTQEEIEGYIKEPGRAGTQWEQRSTATGNLHGYTNVSIPSASESFDVLEVNYYDRYDGIGLPANLNKVGTAGISAMTQGLLVAKKTKVLGSNDVYLWTVYYYDDRGDNIRTLSQHYKGGVYNLNNYDDVINEYTFTHQLQKSVRNHYAGTTAIAVTVTTEYTYDHRDRLIDTWKTVTGGTKTLVARNEYNEVGQLKKKNLHSINQGGSYGQSITYAYNERGWLRTANAPLFNQELQYNTGATKYYNGNIAYQVFTRKYSASATASGTYSYTYDGLNRLTTGMMAKGAGREELTYDKLGNIQKLYRRDGKGLKADSLRYIYTAGKLSQVIDDHAAAPLFNPHLAGTTNYTYDANGNMLTKVNSTNTANNITATVYNYLDLPQSVTVGGTAISYVYDGSGRKLRSTNGINGQTRDYINGIEYSGTALELIHMEEGRILKSGTTYSYEYILKDHLGNARSGFAGGTTAATVPSFGTDYYPFGLQYVADPTTSIAGSPKNNYLYNGKELQDKLKQYDYGARFYDPVIGRFGTIDRYAEKYYDMAPYQYAANNPVVNIDVNGDSTWVTTRTVGDGVNSTKYVTTHITGKVLNSSNNGKVSASSLAKSLNARLNGQTQSTAGTENSEGGVDRTIYNIDAQYTGANSIDDIGANDHLVVMVDNILGSADKALGGGKAGGIGNVPGMVAYVKNSGDRSDLTEFAFHEVGHNLGLSHPSANNVNNPMSYTGRGSNFSLSQMYSIYANANSGLPNQGGNRARIMNVLYFNNSTSTNSRPYTGIRKPGMIIPKPVHNK